MVEDSPCTGDCRMQGTRCRSCKRTFEDLEQWMYLSKEARLYRMEQLKKQS